VDIRDDRGTVLSPATATTPAAQTDVYDRVASQADAEATRIIDANLGTHGARAR
jgi:membrane fusion protein, multidrug efflux system